jgi:hypothetical protein
VRPDDVAVTFPTGASVIDVVQKIAYTVLDDGKYELKPLADSEAGVLHVPPDARVTDDVGPAAARSYKTTPITNERQRPPF